MTRLLLWPVWWLAILLAIVTGIVWGFLPAGVDWFDVTTLNDRLVSVGGYTASAAILLLAATALEAFRGPRGARLLAITFAALYTFLALRAGLVVHGSGAPASEEWSALLDGARGPVMTPWSWFLIGTGAWGFARLVRAARPASSMAPRAV